MGIMAGQSRTFESKKKSNALVFFGVTGIISILVYIIVSYQFDIINFHPSNSYALRFIIAGSFGLVSGILALILNVKINKQVIITIDDETFTYTKGDKVETFPLGSYAGTNVVRNYMNGGYVGSNRYIKFVMPGSNSVRQFELPFEEQEYAEIISLIDRTYKAHLVSEEAKEEIKGSFEEEVKIDFPRDELNEAFSKSRKIRALWSVITLVISWGVCIVFFLTQEFWIFLAILLLFGVIGTTLAIAIFLYGRKESIAALKATPACFTAGTDSISFDQETINTSDISRITVTPPSYESTGKEYEFRTIVIADIHGADHTFYFGKTRQGDKKMALPEYASIVSVLETWCFSNNIDFRQDLG